MSRRPASSRKRAAGFGRQFKNRSPSASPNGSALQSPRAPSQKADWIRADDKKFACFSAGKGKGGRRSLEQFPVLFLLPQIKRFPSGHPCPPARSQFVYNSILDILILDCIIIVIIGIAFVIFCVGGTLQALRRQSYYSYERSIIKEKWRREQNA